MVDFGKQHYLPLRLGQIVATPGAIDAMKQSGVTAMMLLVRHSAGDWGTVPTEDAELNDQALVEGSRVLSSYEVSKGVTIWVITEADRSVTTLLLPSEY